MAYDIAMNTASGDLVVKNGDLMIIDNAERIAQQILITLREWSGEWFLNTADGIPYLEYILVKNPNEDHIRQILSEAILDVDGVQSITSMDLTFSRVNRSLIVEYEAITDYGLITERSVLGYGNS
jgi:hypothetical protein